MKLVLTYSFVVFVHFLLPAQEKQLSFLPVEDGLTNNWVSAIAQDSMGFIWVGTQDGLHRYDGYQFEVLRNSPEQKQSLAANWIRSIAVDTNNDFWIGTYGGGITKFSPQTMKFTNFAIDTANGFNGKLISKILSLDDDHVIGASEAGFAIFNTMNNQHYNLGVGAFNAAFTSYTDTVWLAISKNELVTYRVSDKQLRLLHTFNTPIYLLKHLPDFGLLVGLTDRLILYRNGRIQAEIPISEKVIGVVPDGLGGYFIATNSAIFKFNPKDLELKKVTTNLNLSNKNIQTIFNDKQGGLWVGTDKGLSMQRKYNPAFLQKSIPLHARRIIKKDALYVGGATGLYKVSDTVVNQILDQKPILSLVQYSGTIFSSARNAEVYKLMNDQLQKKIPLFEDPERKLSVLGLARDQQSRLWVGSWEGLFVFDESDDLLKYFWLKNQDNNREQYITNLYIDTKDRLWITTSAYGVYMINDISNLSVDAVVENLIQYQYEEGNKNSITSNLILTLEEDDFGKIWFGTDVGVVNYNENDGSFSRLYYQGKLFDKKVMAIRKDDAKNLWITTINDGIYVLSQEDRSIRHFTTNDGLISNAFLYGSGYYDQEKRRMYFGTDEGIQLIDLSIPFYDNKNSTPVLTAFEVNEASSELFSPLTSPFLNEVSLKADQNDFSIRFSALDFIHQDKINYYYSFDDKPWKVTDLQTAYFTNVPYGNHVLKVKAVYDHIMDDSDGAQLRIYVAPPWYYSPMAKVIYSLLVVAVLLGLYKYLMWRWQMKADLRLQQEKAEHFKKLNDFKSKLYTDIAHEFKTPLTLISGPIEMKLNEKTLSDNDRSSFSSVKRNANRLISLVDQLLDLARLENGNLRLNVDRGDLSVFLHMIADSYRYQADLKGMQYDINIQSLGEVWYDDDILEKIVNNLLSNAFKYSPEGGLCKFSVVKKTNHIVIEVKNTAKEAANLDFKKIFTRFYQRDEHAEGMGVGLALVKELTHFYGGIISGDIEKNSVITFKVNLPYQYDSFRVGDIRQNDQSGTVKNPIPQIPAVSNNENATQDSDLPILLVAEDATELRSFIKGAFTGKYQVLEAENGEKALKLAQNQVPDVIISDVHMPVFDGIELCNTLKADERTSHIPIILLTGDASEENELKGLSSGADTFLAKPFKLAILEQHITNIINTRKQLHLRYSNELAFKPREIAITSADEAFLERVRKILDEELTNPEFNAATFSKLANVSRMQLHRKLMAYTGLSTTAFIRSQRLKQAIHILETSNATINEVAYTVGFSTPSYFMKCFKEMFNKTPSEYLRSGK